VMWHFSDAVAAVVALASAGQVGLGLDLRSDGHETESENATALATEVPLSSFDSTKPSNAVEANRSAAIAALQRPVVVELVAEGYSWVLITCDDD